MKRLASLICVLVMTLAVGTAAASGPELRGFDAKAGYQYVAMGEYPQDADGTARPILWRVLSVEDGEAYLLSEYILGNGCIHPDDKEYVSFDRAFNKTKMFARLNGEFAEAAFTALERSRLRQDEELGTVFLVTSKDLGNNAMGFGSDKARVGFGTPYALANGLFKYQNGSSPYWTRTPSDSARSGVRCTKVKGAVGYIRCVVENEGFRPAVRLILGEEAFDVGQGTMTDPFRYKR